MQTNRRIRGQSAPKDIILSFTSNNFMHQALSLGNANTMKCIKGAYERFKRNPASAGISLKQINRFKTSSETVMEASIRCGPLYKLVGFKMSKQGRNFYIWTWIGTHNQFDRKMEQNKSARELFGSPQEKYDSLQFESLNTDEFDKIGFIMRSQEKDIDELKRLTEAIIQGKE